MLSRLNKNTVIAYNIGYRVVDGAVISPFSGKPRKLYTSTGRSNYKSYEFSFTDSERKRRSVRVHRLVAYQKFKEKTFEKGMQIRHLDGNSLNNCECNIALGTPSDNLMDIPKETRVKRATHAASFVRKFSDKEHEEIREYHKKKKSYKDTLKKFNIRSGATLGKILNCNYVTSI